MATGFSDLDQMTGGPAALRPDHRGGAARDGQDAAWPWAWPTARRSAHKQDGRHLQPGDVGRATGAARALDGDGVDSHRLRLGQIDDNEWDRISRAFGRLSEAPIFVDDSAACSIMDVRSKARRLQAEQGLDLIIIDYLQLMSGRRTENRVQEISEISRGLKGLARELNVPVVALSQLSRAVETRADHRPMLSDLRESGSIEQDADIVLFIYREDKYDEESEKKGIAEIIVAKHRNGPVGSVNLRFFDRTARFADLELYPGPGM